MPARAFSSYFSRGIHLGYIRLQFDQLICTVGENKELKIFCLPVPFVGESMKVTFPLNCIYKLVGESLPYFFFWSVCVA